MNFIRKILDRLITIGWAEGKELGSREQNVLHIYIFGILVAIKEAPGWDWMSCSWKHLRDQSATEILDYLDKAIEEKKEFVRLEDALKKVPSIAPKLKDGWPVLGDIRQL